MKIDTSIQGYLLNIFWQFKISEQSQGTWLLGYDAGGGGAGGAGGIDEDGGVDGAGGAGDACGVGGADALDCTWRERQQSMQQKNGMYKENQENLLGTFSKHIIFCLCFSLTQFLLCPKMSYV